MTPEDKAYCDAYHEMDAAIDHFILAAGKSKRNTKLQMLIKSDIDSIRPIIEKIERGEG